MVRKMLVQSEMEGDVKRKLEYLFLFYKCSVTSFLSKFYFFQCWETSLGQEVYRLILMDFIFGVIGTALAEFIRKRIYM